MYVRVPLQLLNELVALVNNIAPEYKHVFTEISQKVQEIHQITEQANVHPQPELEQHPDPEPQPQPPPRSTQRHLEEPENSDHQMSPTSSPPPPRQTRKRRRRVQRKIGSSQVLVIPCL